MSEVESESLIEHMQKEMQRFDYVKDIAVAYQTAESKGLAAFPISREDAHIEPIMAVPPPPSLRDNFEQVVSECRPLLLTYAYRIVRDLDVAEDVVQEALVKAHAHITGRKNYLIRRERFNNLPNIVMKDSEGMLQIKEINKPIPWLHMIVTNTAKNYCISKKTALVRLQGKIREEIEQELEDYRFEQPEQALIHSENDSLLWALVETLPQRMRTAVKLRYVLEDDYQTIADKLNYPVNTVRSDLRRARKRLMQPAKRALGIADECVSGLN